MVNSARSQLIRLIRLLDHDLSPAEGIEVRQQLADSIQLAQRYRLLMQTMTTTQASTAEELLEHTADVSADQIARLVDGDLPPEDEDTLVEQCWNIPSLLREVVVAVRAAAEVPEASPNVASLNHISRNAANRIHDELPPSDPQPVRPHSVVEPQVNARRQTSTRAREDSPAAIGVSQILKRRRSASLLLITTVALLAVAIVLRWWPILNGNQPGTPESVAGQLENRQSAAPSERTGHDIPEQSLSVVDTEIPSNDTSSVSQQNRPSDAKSAAEHRSNDSAAVASSGNQIPVPQVPVTGTDSANSNRTELSPPMPLPQQPTPESLSAAIHLVSEWRNVRGIVGRRDPGHSTWQGIHSRRAIDASDIAMTENPDTGILTMSHSGATAALRSNLELIVDSDSWLAVSRSATDAAAPASATVSTEDDLTQVDLHYGRFVLTRIPRGQQVAIRAADQQVLVTSEIDDAVVGAERSGNEIWITVWRGTARSGSHQLTRRQWLRMEASGSINAERAPADASEWYRSRSAADVIPDSVARQFNTSQDLATTARSLLTAMEPETAYYSTQTALCVATATADASASTESFPAELVRINAESSVESHRQALIGWTLLTMHQSGRADEVFQAVCRAIELDLVQEPQLGEWYTAAISRQRPSLQQLTQLYDGLRPQKPLFVRQSAKYFLQQILGDPLNEYNPWMPTDRAAMNTIARKMRAWQQANPE